MVASIKPCSTTLHAFKQENEMVKSSIQQVCIVVIQLNMQNKTSKIEIHLQHQGNSVLQRL